MAFNISSNDSVLTDNGSKWIYLPYMVTLAVIFIQTILGIIANVLLLVTLGKTVLIHINVRFHLANISLASVLLCSYCLIWALRNAFMAPGIWANNIPALNCMLQEIPFTIGLMVQFYSVIGLGLERLWSIKMRQHNESSKGILGKMLALTLWIWAAVICALNVLAARHLNPIYYCALALFVTSKWVLYFVAATTIAGDAFSLALYYYIFRYNRETLSVLAVNQAKSTLRGRYQIRRNLEITQMLFPSVLLHGIVHCLAIPTAIIVYKYRFLLNPSIALVVNCQYMVILMHSIMHPVLCFRASHVLVKTLKNSFRRIPTVEAECTEMSDDPITVQPDLFIADNHHMTFEEHERILLQAWSGDLGPARKMSLLSVKSGHEFGMGSSGRKASLLSVKSELSAHSEDPNDDSAFSA